MGRDIYRDDKIQVTAFFGGVDRGACVQINVGSENTQMKKAEFINFLKRCLKELE